MKRKIYNNLLNWKQKRDFKPLLVLGVRQCGKTYIIDEFCKNEYRYYKKINLYQDTKIVELYKSNKNSDEKIIYSSSLLFRKKYHNICTIFEFWQTSN